jgi:hypothetical protein
MLDQAALPWFAELNRSLCDRLDDAAFQARMRASAEQLQVLAGEIVQRADREYPGLDSRALCAVLAERSGPAPPAMATAPMLFEPA